MRTGPHVLHYLLVAIACGCSSPQPHVEDNELGIVRIDVARGPTGLEITGLDHEATVVARAVLFEGEVSWDPDLTDEPQLVEGRSLTVQVADDPEFVHVSRGEPALQLPPPRNALKTGAFLRLARVADVLGAERITVAELPHAEGTEEAFATMLGVQPCQTCNYSGCAMSGTVACGYGVPQFEWRCCASGTFAERHCPGPNQTGYCGTAGQQGCVPCWTSSWSSSCTVQTVDTGCTYPEPCPFGQYVCQAQWN